MALETMLLPIPNSSAKICNNSAKISNNSAKLNLEQTDLIGGKTL
jgi:hypothetical protein